MCGIAVTGSGHASSSPVIAISPRAREAIDMMAMPRPLQPTSIQAFLAGWWRCGRKFVVSANSPPHSSSHRASARAGKMRRAARRSLSKPLAGRRRQQERARRDCDDQGVVAPNMSYKMTDWAIQAHGAAVVSQDFWLAEAYATSGRWGIVDGPDEVHRSAIAKLEPDARGWLTEQNATCSRMASVGATAFESGARRHPFPILLHLHPPQLIPVHFIRPVRQP